MTIPEIIIAIAAVIVMITLIGKGGKKKKPEVPVIKNSPEFDRRIQEALNFLKGKSASEYGFVMAKIRAYQEDSESYIDTRSRIFHIGPKAMRTNGPIWLASIMVHDAQHILQHEQDKEYTRQQAELDANARQTRFLRAIGATHYANYVAGLDGTHYLTV